ncbi:PREDICTED: uncharacterized protein LOC108967434 [Bactrocera latifrons]|uniref:uncharacterized protein LOC108967434 n=1 Tax=Bactrocera latifrons TaxID=174628 RepID=UPI0008DC5E8B|nr:PREDICTED: uncharacterized protein LOC108967434 [Bactrocera latifrons]
MHQPGNITEEFPSTSETAIGGEVKKPETQTDKTFSRCHSIVLTEDDYKQTISDSYQKRLQNLRKELNYISETDWMYESANRKAL